MVFANSRKKCEQLFACLNQEGAFSQHVLLHYSNLSTKEQRLIESSFRKNKKAICIATSTLEMGIDIGDVDGVVLMGPPPTAMAFLQRIGRANRRQQRVKFWGVCYGLEPESQLLRFLALFRLASENKMENPPSAVHYSVLFQQILSCLYAKKVISEASMKTLLNGSELSSIFQEMIAKHWLKPMHQFYQNQPPTWNLDCAKSNPGIGLFSGGWRYGMAVKNNKIWSNFPPTDEEYDVILGEEIIAVLPLSAVRLLKVGDVIQLAGKGIKIIKIEEKNTFREIWVEASNEDYTKDLLWCGFGILTSYDIAQEMAAILFSNAEPPGLLNRTRQLLQKARRCFAQSESYSSGVRVHRLQSGAYRYETFLGSIGNFVIHLLIKNQCGPKMKGLFVHFDELGIETNEWISFEALTFPCSAPLFKEIISSYLPLFKQLFPWNRWIHWLPENLQKKEIYSCLHDRRILEQFERYQKESRSLVPPCCPLEIPEPSTRLISLKGEPWSIRDERQAWGELEFPEFPQEPQDDSLTASQVQAYVEKKLCPRLSRFQYLRFATPTHSRFHDNALEVQSRRQADIAFKKQVLDELQKKNDVRWETTHFSLAEAVQEVLLGQKPLFLACTKLILNRFDKGRLNLKTAVEGDKATQDFELESPLMGGDHSQTVKAPPIKSDYSLKDCVNLPPSTAVFRLKGSPDLIYLKPEDDRVCAEIWDVKSGYVVTYGQKWRTAFYAYLLECFLNENNFGLTVKVSDQGGLIYRHPDKEKLFARTPFQLFHFKSWIPRLIAQWRTGATQSPDRYTVDSTCTTCSYFSYCYQETLYKESTKDNQAQAIVSLEIASNDFPRNSKQWFYINHSKEAIHWQCWEAQELVSDTHLDSKEYPNWITYQEAVVEKLLRDWRRAVEQQKTPHFLVFKPSEWYFFQTAFQATPLRVLWSMHVCWTSIQSILQKHFLWPIQGQLTAVQVGLCLGFISDPPPALSLYHDQSEAAFDLNRRIWNWCLSQVKSRRIVPSFGSKKSHVPLINTYLAIHHRELEYRTHEILEFQKNPLAKRVQSFRAIGPLIFLDTDYVSQQQHHTFSIEAEGAVMSKFRVGDFLRLSPVGSSHIQDGFLVVLESYSPEKKCLSIRSLSQKVHFSKTQRYVLDECAIDRNASKIDMVLNRLKDPQFRPELIYLLQGYARSFPPVFVQWAEQWILAHEQETGLNPLQKKALMLPFLANIGLIEGPPGTGKTHTLVWTLIALLAHAESLQRPIKILVTAQTHQAIDQILRKIALMLRLTNTMKVPLWKYGRYDKIQFPDLGIESLTNSKPLNKNGSLVVGATGFGVYQLLEGKNFPQLFDWIVFDESSQMLPSYALLSLIFGKGNALFYGDTQQLPPVLHGDYEYIGLTPRSILAELITKGNDGLQNCVHLSPSTAVFSTPLRRLRLNETYRMNDTICQFASRHWYDGDLRSSIPQEKQQLDLTNYPLSGDDLDHYLDPAKAMVFVQLDHEECQHSSLEEALWIAQAVKRLIEGYAISVDELGIISPYRLQNNTISSALKEALPSLVKLPKIDTVERMQGQEFDIVIFSATVSDKTKIHNAFLKDHRRFNVALTRARKKFLFVASRLFFQTLPTNEKELTAHFPFQDFLEETGNKVFSIS